MTRSDNFAMFAVALLTTGAFATAPPVSALAEPSHGVFLITDRDASEPERFELDSLAVGQAQQWTTASGSVVVVTRTAGGYEVDVDGKTSKIKLLDDSGPMVWVQGHQVEGDDAAAEGKVRSKVIVHREASASGDDAATHFGYAFVVGDQAADAELLEELSEALRSGGRRGVMVVGGEDGKKVKVVRLGAGSVDDDETRVVIDTDANKEGRRVVIIERQKTKSSDDKEGTDD